MWQLLLILFFIFGAINHLLRRVLAQELGDHNRVVNLTFYLFFLLPSAIILFFLFPGAITVSWIDLFFLLTGSILWPLLAITSFRANKDVDVGIFAIISNVSPLFTLLIALFILNESVTSYQYVGIALLVISGVIAASSQLQNHTKASKTGILYSFLCALLLGVAIAYEQFMLSRIDFGTYMIYGWGSQIVWAILFTSKQLKQVPSLFRKSKRISYMILAWGAAGGLRSISFITALKISGSAAIISAATDFMSVVVVISAYLFLKERKYMISKWAAAIIGIAGLLLVTH